MKILLNLKKIFILVSVLAIYDFAVAQGSDESSSPDANAFTFENHTLQWINHLDFLPGHPVVKTSFNSVNPGTLVVRSTTLGETVPGGGNKVVEMSLQVPPRHILKGVRICYKTTNRRSFISQVRLAQLQNPPTSWLVRLDDPTDHNSTVPTCVNSMETPIPINPVLGSLRMPLRFYFGSINDSIIIYSVGLWLMPY